MDKQILDQTDQPFTKLDRVLLRCGHGATLSWDQRLNQTRAVHVPASGGKRDRLADVPKPGLARAASGLN
jgi:hypothetical protein